MKKIKSLEEKVSTMTVMTPIRRRFKQPPTSSSQTQFDDSLVVLPDNFDIEMDELETQVRIHTSLSVVSVTAVDFLFI
jgi:hypothetical protein